MNNQNIPFQTIYWSKIPKTEQTKFFLKFKER